MAKIICTVTNDLSQDQRMIRICSSLARADYEVVLVGREQPHSLPLRQESFQQVRLKCWFNKGKFFYLEYNLRLFVYLLLQSGTIINAIDLDTLLPAYLVCRLRGKTCVYDAHEYFTEVPEVIRRPMVQRVWTRLADALIPKLDYCYTVGPALAHIMSERYGPRFSVIRNVPFRRRPTLRQQQEAPYIILYQGMLNEGRGLEVAIEAMRKLPSCELWLAGSGDVTKALKAQVQRLGLEDRVRFLGFVPPDELPALTEKAWLGLNLLENLGLSYYYSLANKAFDYIQSGVPSIQMDFPEYRALQEQYSVFGLLSELQPDLLAQHIQHLMDDPERYAQLQENCLEAAANLCWEREEEDLLAFYDRIFSASTA